jgi:SAM-dependent methyltransferase
MSIDQNRLNEFMGKLVGDLGAAMSGALVVLGDKLGLYRELAKGPATAGELAGRSKTAERYVREWLNAQAASGYVSYDPDSKRYRLPPEHAMALADESSPVYFSAAFQLAQAMWNAEEKLEQRFRSGEGMEWGAHHPCLFEGTERFFRPGYVGNLMQSWIPALDGVEDKLKGGARVADVGCGHGASTILMAQAYPSSKFYGFDSHGPSIECARERAKQAGLEGRVIFQVAGATDFPGSGYDLVAHFDCFHDLESPVGAAKQVRRALAQDGTWLIVEPFASDRDEENHNPVGRVFYSASTMICVPHSLSQHGPALGAQAGEARLRRAV